jgi:two-component sensor histidine kinase
VLFFICLPVLAQDPCVMQDSLKKRLTVSVADTAKVNLLNKLAGSYLQSDASLTPGYAKEARTLATQLHYEKGIADAMVNMAVYTRQQGDYSGALEQLLQAVTLYEKLNAPNKQAGTYIQIAQVYKDMAGPNQTIEYINKGIAYSQECQKLYRTINDWAGVVNSLNMQGILYRDRSKITGQQHYYDTAYAAYSRALELITRYGQGKEHIPKLYNNVSQYFMEYKKDYHQALDYLFKAVALNTINGNLASLSYNYGNITHAYVELRDLNQALIYGRKTLAAAQQLKRPERLRNAYNSLYDVFQTKGMMDSALHYYVLSDEVDDSLNSVAKNNEVVHLQTKYEAAKKEVQIQNLQAEGLHKNRRITWLAAGIILFALLTGCMIWLYSRMRKQRQQITLQSQHLEVMMKELHHRVKNNLQIVSSLLSLQTYKVQDEGAVSVLRESQQRVQAMSFIHQRLYKKEELTAVNMRDYLTDLAESLLASYGFQRDEFDLQIQIENDMMDIDKALPIGLVINEMVTNALKYAYQGIQHPSLLISLMEDASNLVFVIKDNGIGINEQAWKQKSNSFGKQLITALCKQLRARQTLVIDGGTAFTITIPKQAA